MIFPSELRCSAKLFAYDTSLFLVVTATNLNKYYENLGKWTPPWKLFFNRDPTKMTYGVLFSRKKKFICPNLTFIGKDVNRSQSQKHLVLVINPKR